MRDGGTGGVRGAPIDVIQSRNPLHLRSGIVESRQMAVPTHFIYRDTDYSTTDIANFFATIAGVIRTYMARSVLSIDLQLQAKHSAAPANADMGIGLYHGRDSTFTGFTVVRRDVVLIGHANFWSPISMHVEVDLEEFAYQPGEHWIALLVRNNTAGTLTIDGDGAVGWLMTTKEFGVGGGAVKFIAS